MKGLVRHYRREGFEWKGKWKLLLRVSGLELRGCNIVGNMREA